MNEFKMVPLAAIKPDANQPRKYYDESAMQELTDSIREKGILQPILIRPDGDDYLIVCGERRYRAALSVNALFTNRNEIPAVIRELSDDEALELQIIENLQRKDVHPMEEAFAFKSLLDHGKELKEVAARVGKSEFYVRQRLKLNDLTKKWQEVFYKGRLNHGDALKICVFPHKEQDVLFEDAASGLGLINLNHWSISKLKGELSKATFDITSADLVKKAGACTVCPFNSAVSSLFPEDAQKPICSNKPCFANKTDAAFNIALESHINNPEMIFVSTDYYNKDLSKQKDLAILVKAKIEVLSKQSYSTIEAPEMITWEEFVEDREDEYDTEKELKEAFKREENSYEQELEAYNKKIDSGKFKKAFVVDGDEKGSVVYISLGKSGSGSNSSSAGSSRATKEKESEGKLTAADIEEEILRIQGRERRAKELDEEKVHSALIELVKASKVIKEVPKKVIEIDRILMLYLITDFVNHFNSAVIKKTTGIDRGYVMKPESMEAALNKITPEQVTFMVRQIMLHDSKFHGTKNSTTTGHFFELLATSIGLNDEIVVLEEKQAAIALKRAEKVKARLAELRAKAKEIQQKKPAAAKPTKNSVSTKKAKAK